MKDKIIDKLNNLLDTELSKKLYIDFIKEKLSSKTIKLNIEDISLEVFLNFHENKMTISTDSSSTDVEISGTLSSFIFYASTSGSDLFSSKISISGDIDSANTLNSFFKESGLLQAIIVELLGQEAASSMYSILEPVKERFTESNKNYNQSLSEFLKYDVDLVPTKHEINDYIDQVDEVKSRTERLLSKIK